MAARAVVTCTDTLQPSMGEQGEPRRVSRSYKVMLRLLALVGGLAWKAVESDTLPGATSKSDSRRNETSSSPSFGWNPSLSMNLMLPNVIFASCEHVLADALSARRLARDDSAVL